MEAPTSLLCSLFANSNRDPKKTKKPYKINDFFIYEPKENQGVPMAVYGAAALELINQGLFPNWALTFYADLKRSADGSPPHLLAFIHEKAIVLAPEIDKEVVTGMLIADEVVSEQVIDMQSNHGSMIRLQMPKLTVRYSAKEGVILPVVD